MLTTSFEQVEGDGEGLEAGGETGLTDGGLIVVGVNVVGDMSTELPDSVEIDSFRRMLGGPEKMDSDIMLPSEACLPFSIGELVATLVCQS